MANMHNLNHNYKIIIRAFSGGSVGFYDLWHKAASFLLYSTPLKCIVKRLTFATACGP